MATRIWPAHSIGGAEVNPTLQRATNTANFAGSNVGWRPIGLHYTQPSTSVQSFATNTVTGPTNGVETVVNAVAAEWLTVPLAADVTISGAITANIWSLESSMNANVAINFAVWKVSAVDGTLTQIVKSARTTELGTSSAAANFTATPGAGVSCNRGDRLRIVIFGDDSSGANMASGFTFTARVGGGSGAGTDGDTYFEFTETFTFDASASPAGTVFYLTDAAGTPSDKLASFTRGAGSVTSATSTATGWTSGIQLTATAGGSTLQWFTPQLNGFTLGGIATCHTRVWVSNNAANAGCRFEIAVVNADGTGAAVWAIGSVIAQIAAGDVGEVGSTSDNTNRTDVIAGDDVSVSSGQRLRFRLYVEDTSGLALVTGHTFNMSYNGPTLDAAGDTHFTLAQTVTEVAGYQPRFGFANFQDPAIFMEKLRPRWSRRRSGILVPEYA